MELPSLAKEGWLRPLRKSGEASLAGADGVVRSSHRLSEVERTTPAAPFKGRGHLFDGAATPPLPRRGVRFSHRFSPMCSSAESLQDFLRALFAPLVFRSRSLLNSFANRPLH